MHAIEWDKCNGRCFQCWVVAPCLLSLCCPDPKPNCSALADLSFVLLLTRMAVNLPFKRWIYDESTCYRDDHGGHYYLIPTHGRRVLAAVSVRLPAGSLSYVVHRSFRRIYGATLTLEGDLVWSDPCQLSTWLHAQVHNSFTRASSPGVGRCWFFKRIWEHDAAGQMIVPLGLRPYLQSTGVRIWILLRHGSKAWPVCVLNDRLQRGWATFRNAHRLSPIHKLVLACERRWIFDVTVLGPDDREVFYSWSFNGNGFWRDFYPVQNNLETACLPSIVRSDCTLSANGVWCIPEVNYHQVFQTIFNPLLLDSSLGDALITMGRRNWVIPLDNNGSPNHPIFDAFLAELGIEAFDYLFIVVLAGLRVKVIVFDRQTHCEKLYDWF